MFIQKAIARCEANITEGVAIVDLIAAKESDWNLRNQLESRQYAYAEYIFFVVCLPVIQTRAACLIALIHLHVAEGAECELARLERLCRRDRHQTGFAGLGLRAGLSEG